MKNYKALILVGFAILSIGTVLIFSATGMFNRFAHDQPEEHGSPLIVMVWELAGITADYSSIGPMETVDVVSPTWLHLEDETGSIRSEIDPAYLAWAHGRGYQIWALVTNSFDPELTAALLSNPEMRSQFAADLVDLALEFELDGLNIDFENFHSDYKDHFTALVRELAELTNKNNLVLSVDVSMISGTEYWSLGYDRQALAEAADYIVLMAYDEHYQASPRAGSVASLPWVEQGLTQVLQEVPAEKLILGVPFYTRLFEIDESGETPQVLNSWSYSMHRAREIIETYDARIYYDELSNQHVAEYENEGLTYRMWLEDSHSMQKRLELVGKYNLAGVAAWRRGLETPEIWDLFSIN